MKQTKEYHAKWRANNPEKFKKIQKEWYEKNKERILYKKKQQRPKNAAHARLRRAIKAGKIDKPTHCAHCNKTNTTIAAYWNYPYELSNIVWLCMGCLLRKRKEEVSDVT